MKLLIHYQTHRGSTGHQSIIQKLPVIWSLGTNSRISGDLRNRGVIVIAILFVRGQFTKNAFDRSAKFPKFQPFDSTIYALLNGKLKNCPAEEFAYDDTYLPLTRTVGLLPCTLGIIRILWLNSSSCIHYRAIQEPLCFIYSVSKLFLFA